MNAQEFISRFNPAGLKPVYAVHGEERYFAWRIIDLVRKAVVAQAGPNSVHTAEPKDSFTDFVSALRTRSLFAETDRRLVLMEDADDFIQKNREHLEHYLESPSPGSVLLLSCRKWNGSTRLAKAVDKIGVSVETRRLYPNQLRAWLIEEAKRLDKRLMTDAADMIAEATGSDLFALHSEIEKLSCYVGEEQKITKDDAAAVCNQARPYEIFELTDAVGRHDARKALSCARELLKGAGSERILSMLAWQWRRLWAAKKTAAAGGGPEQLASLLGVRGGSSYPFKLLMGQAERFTEDELRRKERFLVQADIESKTTSMTGDAYGRMIETLVIRLCS
ncbi:MAG TPA: DNA polymerase III subunit delta [Candidatus Brocadiia bacterium]|nr:DNA polymerase III subunit delta [Candidatus Brocadiia bacterium]